MFAKDKQVIDNLINRVEELELVNKQLFEKIISLSDRVDRIDPEVIDELHSDVVKFFETGNID